MLPIWAVMLSRGVVTCFESMDGKIFLLLAGQIDVDRHYVFLWFFEYELAE